MLAQAHAACGEADQALAAAREGVTLGSDPKTSIISFYVYNAANLALAEAASGNQAAGALRLERMLCAIDDNPMICGHLHEKRTMVAMAAGDREKVRHHLKETEYWFRSSGNPALVARFEKLAAQVAFLQAKLDTAHKIPNLVERITGRPTADWSAA